MYYKSSVRNDYFVPLSNGGTSNVGAGGSRAPLTALFLADLKGHNTQHSGHRVQNIHNELIVKICSKSLVRNIGKVFLMQFS